MPQVKLKIKLTFSVLGRRFRGEAIPSIASISHFTVKTATADENYGTLLVAKGGEIEKQETISTPVGTKITVENLFYNTPARL